MAPHESKLNFARGSISYPNFLDWQKDNRGFPAMAAARRYNFSLTGKKDVLRLVLWQGTRLALLGVAIGLGVALGLTRLMTRLLYGISATDPATFAGLATVLTAIAIAACWIPARRAMRVDPVVALRYE